MGSASSRFPVEAKALKATPMTVLNCGCSLRTAPDDRHYQYFDLKSTIGNNENVLPREHDYYSTHVSTPPFIGSSYGKFPSQESNMIHLVSPDSKEDVEIDVIERSVLISPPNSTNTIIVLDTEINLHTSREENDHVGVLHSIQNNNNVLPRKLFDENCSNTSSKPELDLSPNHVVDDDDEEEDEEEEDDFDIINPHSSDPSGENTYDRRIPCHLLIPRCTSSSTEYLNAACLSLSLKTNHHFPRNRSADTPPTVEATISDSSIDSTDTSVDDEDDAGNHSKESTLPSLEYGKPIRLKVTEKYNTSNPSTLGPECFSYDPYFNIGEYSISDMNGQSYGNDLHLTMAGQYMYLQDIDSRVWAVTRNRCTFLPSYVLYAPIPRYEGQSPSTHRIMNDISLTAISDAHIHLYPWALIKKEGRRVEHDITVHMATEGEASVLLDGQFETCPSYRTRRILDPKRNYSHSVMYRVSDNNTVAKPCCLFSRQMNNSNTFDVIISPGIDPLFMICTLAVKCKMDLEPKLNN